MTNDQVVRIVMVGIGVPIISSVYAMSKGKTISARAALALIASVVLGLAAIVAAVTFNLF